MASAQGEKCPECRQRFKTRAALGSHLRYRHAVLGETVREREHYLSMVHYLWPKVERAQKQLKLTQHALKELEKNIAALDKILREKWRG